jgi:ATP-dependent protease ClpP protease subunit
MTHLIQPGLRAVNLRKARLLDRIGNQQPALAQEIRNLKLNWFKMRNQDGEGTGGDGPNTGAAEIFIYDEIGGSFGVGAQDFVDGLNEIEADEIVVRINSPGGLVVDAIAIGSALRQHPANIITRVDGIAASAASIVAVAGDTLEMMLGSQLMLHDVLVDVTGNAADLKELIGWLNEQSMNVAGMYAAKAGSDDIDEWRAVMLAETWMFAQEAVDSGLADSIYSKGGKPPFPPKTEPDNPDEEDPEKEDPEKKNPDEEDDEDESDAESKNAIEQQAIDILMNRSHRLTNRGFKYLGREKAPAPQVTNSNSFADLVRW